MKTTEKIIYTICIGLFLIGFRILFAWSHESRLFGLALVLTSLIAAYFTYTKNLPTHVSQQINIKNIGLGLLLIVVDVTYNLYTSDAFRSLDQGMLASGTAIILLNTGVLRFLKLDEKMISFSTYFLFFVMTLYSLAFFIPKELYFNRMTDLSVTTAAFLLNFIKPTSTYAVINYPDLYNVMINFGDLVVGIGVACSGVASITVFLAAIISFYIASTKKNVKKMLMYTCIGVFALYFINVLRIIILVLIADHYGLELMNFVHIHLGWIMFVLGMAVFWFLVFDDL